MSEWMSLRGVNAQLFKDGKGFACILPARHGSQIGSCILWDCKLMPVTSFFVIASLIPAWWWCLNCLCHSVISVGKVKITIAFSELFLVEPSRKAELLSFILAMIHRFPFLWNSILCDEIVTLKGLLHVRCIMDSKLFWIFGTCNTQCSSTVLPVLPLIHSSKSTDSTPSE